MRESHVAPVSVELRARSRGRELSHSQFLMWLGQELEADVPLYNMVHTFRIDGAVDPGVFAQAWQSLVDASDTLRSTIEVVDGTPRRFVADKTNAVIEVIDLRSSADPEAEAQRWAHERKTRILRLDAQLWDSALLLVADDVVVWYLSQHHIISDAHSFSVVLKNLADRYQLALSGDLDAAPALSQFEEYVTQAAAVQTTAAWQKSQAYWATKAADPIDPTPFYGRSVSGTSSRVDRLVVDLGRERSDRLREITTMREFRSISPELSLYSIWSTLLFTLLHRTDAGSKLRIGSPFFARPTPEFRDTIGLFVEVGALDVTISADDTFATLAKRVQRQIIHGIRHARPGIATAELNRSFDVLMNFVTSRLATFGDFDVQNEWLHTGYGDRDHALRVQITDFEESGELRLHLDVNAELFGEVERAWLLDQFDRVIEQFLQDPTQALAGFDLLGDAERLRYVDQFNNTDAAYPQSKTVIDLFEEQVLASPGATALQQADRLVTYGELQQLVHRLARDLRRRGVINGERVAILVPRSIDAVVAILGVMAAGGAWVPIDPNYPAARRDWMIDDADPAVVITSNGDLAPDDRWQMLDLSAVVDDGETGSPSVERSPDHLAYMIYTSGSTGTPKGAMLTHGGLMNYLWWARSQYTDGKATDFALYSSLSFDLTITSLFLPLITGGRAVVYGESPERAGLEILDVFADDSVDVVKLTPSHLGLLREQGFSCDRIGRLIVGGENLRTELANDISSMFDHDVMIFNEYGPTEAVVGCMIHRFDPTIDTDASVPIGVPAANTAITVVDQHGRLVPAGVTGEMVITSDGVALGYHNRPELTNDRFAGPADSSTRRSYRTGDLARWDRHNRLEFLGRGDDQVKIRGARIELGEIETALLAHPEIDSGVVDVVSFADMFSGAIDNCTRCGLPSNQPDADFDDDQVCGDCRAFAEHRAEVDRYFRTPQDLTAELVSRREVDRSSPYDSLVLVSGGKDSTYMLYQLVREFDVRPLVFLLDNGYISESAIDNVRAACEDLDIDVHIASTPHMNDIFVDSLKRHANVCDGCYKTIYTLSLAVAREYGIPTIITGLARGQLFETRLADTFKAREFDPDTIDAWVLEARKAYHAIEDTVTERLAGDLFDGNRIFDEVDFIDFYRYIDVGLDEVYRYLTAETVWTRPPDTGRSTNCLINDVGIHYHTTTQGHHNYAVPYSWDVRLGHKERAAAMDELDDDIDIARVHHILDEIGFDEPVVDIRSEKRLAAYFVTDNDLEVGEVRRHLQAVLPDYMVPSYLVPLAELPLTVNGKIDRAALPDPAATRPDLETAYVAPRTDREHELTEIWTSVLRLDEIGVNDNFFELGGDSIMCIQIVAEARRRDIDLSARDIFTSHTIARIAQSVDTERQTPVAAPQTLADPEPFDSRLDSQVIARVSSSMADNGGWNNVEDVFELTPTQLGMLYHCLRSPDSEMYFGQGVCRFEPDLDVDLLRDAWFSTIDRHPMLRSRMVWIGLDAPVQVMQRNVEHRWEVHDWRGSTDDQASDRLDALLAQSRDDGIDIGAASLMSFAVVRTDDSTHFVWNSHHIMLDGWGAQLVHREVLRSLDAAARGDVAPAPPVSEPFRHHVERISQADSTAQLTWWRDTLDGFESSTPIPIMSAADSGDGNHRTKRLTISASATERLLSFARAQQVTAGTIATCAWGLVLAHYSGQSDVVIGTTISGREDGAPDAEHMIGMLLATVPIRITLGTDAVGEWLRSCQLDAFEARAHASVGLADIGRVTAVPAGQQLFDSIVVIENQPTAADGSGSDASALQISNPSNYPLALLVHPGAELVVDAVYDGVRFADADIDRLVGHLEHTLTALAADAQQPVDKVSILPPSQLAELNEWALGTTVSAPAMLIPERIAAVAGSRGQAIALDGPRGSLSYADLHERSNQIGHALRARGIGRGDAVGIVVGSEPLLVAALLAAFKVGAAYVPLDPDLPASRLRHMVEETQLQSIMSVGRSLLPELALDTEPDHLDVAAPEIEELSTADLDGGSEPSDIAYVIYTSGSTGTPKGVTVTHDNLAHSTAARPAFYTDPVRAFLLLSSMAFDSSMVGLFWTLCDGGSIVMPDTERRLDVAHLCELVARHDVSHLLALPSLHRLLLEEGDHRSLASLTTVIVAGESCPASLVELHQEQMPNVALYNEYGPTEATVWSHACRLDETDVSSGVPIGRPIPNTSCVVLDEFGMQTAIGIPGELFIGGPGVVPGYLQRDDLTDEVFGELPEAARSPRSGRFYRTGDLCAWRPDGMLDFVGRVDDQVKVRGYRIELAEIESVLANQDTVQAGAVRVVEAPDGDPMRRRVVAWYASVDGADHTSALTEALALELPKYMVPALLVHVSEMPRTATGKVDRTALTVPDPDPADQFGSGEPADELEATLLEIWRKVLGRDDIGVHDDFFDLGGNSLDAMRLFARIQRRLAHDLLLSTLFESPTVSGLAAVIREPASGSASSAIVPIRARGHKRPFYYVGPHQVSVLELDKIAKYFDPERPFFGLQTSGLQLGEPVLESIEDIATYFVSEIKKHQPHGPYLIGGHCDGSWTALEMARQFFDRGDEVEYLGLADLPPPHAEADAVKSLNGLGRISERARYYRESGRLWNAISWQIQLRLKKNVLLRFGGAAARRERAVRIAHEAAFTRYDPSLDRRMRIHLVRSTEMAVLMDDNGWYDDFVDVLAQKTDISATHARLLLEPESEELAEVFGAAMDVADRRIADNG